MSYTNKIFYKRSDYRDEGELLHAMSEQVSALLRNNYMCSSFRSMVDPNIYVLEFSTADLTISDLIPMWITTAEAVSVMASRSMTEKDDDDKVDFSQLVNNDGGFNA